MESPPYFRVLVLTLMVAGGLFFAFVPQGAWRVTGSAPVITRPIGAAAPRLPDAPVWPPREPDLTVQSGYCPGMETRGQWFMAEAFVSRYDDGDTYTTNCRDDVGKWVRVRLANVNTADRDDCPAMRRVARARVIELIGAKTQDTAVPLWFYVIDRDRYDRTVAHVALLDGAFLGEILLDEGLADPAPGGRVIPFEC